MFRVHPGFAALLTRYAIGDCESLFDTRIGTPLRRLKNRENWRLDLSDGKRTVTLYLKKHRTRTVATCVRALLGLAAPKTPARVEAEWAQRLTTLGVPTMTVAAYGERLRPDGTLVAAFLTEALSGFEQLDLLLVRHFGDRDDPRLRGLIANVADVAARFHRAGLNHRDFYTCHFFVKEHISLPVCESAAGSIGGGRPSTAFAVRLIDLQRVQCRPEWLRRRWVVKDLAQLAYSCPPRLIGPTEQMRFFKLYLGARRLDSAAKRVARAVLRRAAALERKHGPYRDWAAEQRRTMTGGAAA
jgi:heptose I phosphotransferase